MTRPAARFAMFLVFVAALAATGWVAFSTSRHSNQERTALAALDTSLHRLMTELAACGSGIQAYVAVGEGTDGWQGRVGQHIRTVTAELERWQSIATDPNAQNHIDAATAVFAEFNALNDRAARMVRNGQLAEASQIVFGDGIERLASVAHHLDSAWQAELSAASARDAARQTELAYVGAGAGLTAFLVGLLLLPTGTPRRAEPETPGLSGDLDLRAAIPAAGEPTRQEAESGADGQALPAESASNQAAPADPRAPDRRKATELKAMAELCTDLGRLTDPGELQGLFERAARLIDATGFVVWLSDAEGTALRPALAHGYPASAIARIPAIGRDADNATAAAWREGAVHVVRTNGMTPGALVVPLLTTVGCIGAFAAEVRHGREASESVRALTRILAAQLAQLVSVPAAPEASATERESSVV